MLEETNMDGYEFRAFLDLLMCSDPYPVDSGEDAVKGYANRQAVERGFADWIDAYHKHEA